MNVMSVRDIAVKGKRVLVRVDFNVPLDEKTSVITDDSRIKESLPTIRYLLENGARVVLCSHLGRPDGKVVEKLRMGVVAERLARLLEKKVLTTRDSVGPKVEQAVDKLKDGDVLLLENIRFHAEEEENDDSFARAMAKLADVYVDDAFGTAHRAHASIVGVARYIPAVAGILMEKELLALGQILENPVHPFCGMLGGAKISDKVGMLQNIMDKVDCLLIGGGMAATFLKAQSREVGQSLIEENMLDTAARLIQQATKKGICLVLPIDVVVADNTSAGAKTVETVLVDKIGANMKIVDIGTETVKRFQEQLQQCRTIFWNGPMGIYEVPEFARGTIKIAEFLAGIKGTRIIGGGSTAEAVHELGLAEKMTFVSTGGGASLSFLSGKVLPGVEVLRKKTK